MSRENTEESIERSIHSVRGLRVMLDKDLATLYGVKPIALRQQVKRNRKRFPADFMFQLSEDEVKLMVSQNVIPSRRSLGGHLPFVFSQEGVAMLSSVLRSSRAIQVNIEIVRTFVRLTRLIGSHAVLSRKIEVLERRYEGRFKMVFAAIRGLMKQSDLPRKGIGFKSENK